MEDLLRRLWGGSQRLACMSVETEGEAKEEEI